MKNILKKIRKADEAYNLFNHSDNVLIGLSGGKDSMLLLLALNAYQQFDNKNFNIKACYMDLGFGNHDDTILKNYCDSNNIEYYKKDTEVYEILKHYLKNNNNIDCSRCSNLKRGIIVETAKELKCNKIAFAHHFDDALETYFMNQIISAKSDTFKPIIEYKDNNITFIRPLIYCYEKDIIKAVKQNNIPIMKNKCPNDQNSNRQDTKILLNNIYKQYPSAHNNYFKILKNYWKVYEVK